MDSFNGNFCENCQMSFETNDQLCLHSCVDIKEKISDLDASISYDPLSIDRCQNQNQIEVKIKEDINPLSQVSEMINEGNIELAKAIEMVHEYNLMIHKGKNMQNKDKVVPEESNQLTKSSKRVYEVEKLAKKSTNLGKNAETVYARKNEKVQHSEVHSNTSLIGSGYVDFCEICRKNISKYYLKRHMLRIHQIEIIDNEKNQIEDKIQEFKDPLTNHELVNKTTENIQEVQLPIVEHTESKQEIPKIEEISVRVKPVFIRKCKECQESFSSINEYKRHRMLAIYNIDISTCVPNSKFLNHERKNPCSQCDATFKTKRRLSIHMEFVHGKEKENIEIPKAKKQRKYGEYLPLQKLPNPSEILTNRHIFDYIHSLRITPGIYNLADYQNYVFETVLRAKTLTIDKLSKSSFQNLETKAKGLAIKIYSNWRKSSKNRAGLYKRFKNNMEDPFDWVPELMHEETEEKTESIEIVRKEKTFIKEQPFLTPPNPDEMVTKRQIFDIIYSRKITPGKCRNSDYRKHVMETVLSFHKLTLDKVLESSVQKLELKVNSLTSVIYEKWKKNGGHKDRLYEKFPNNMQDPFAWVPELV